MSWTSEVVESLAESKRRGLPFNAAWCNAVQAYPPQLHELGVSRRAEMRLFPSDDDESPMDRLEWYRLVCEAAYTDAPARDGKPSRLRGLHAALRDGWGEEMVRPARHKSMVPMVPA